MTKKNRKGNINTPYSYSKLFFRYCLCLLPTCPMTLTVHHGVNIQIFQGRSPCFCGHLFPSEIGNWWDLLSVWGLHKNLPI